MLVLSGGFTEETLVRNLDSYCFLSQVPDQLDDVTAALLEPASCAFRIAVKAKVKPGDSVVVFGMGAMGLLSAMILRRSARQRKVGKKRSWTESAVQARIS